ncbi:hypothetical protein ES702_00903 [subsurface metagenome]
MKANAEIVRQNIDKSYSKIDEQCKFIVDKIDKILELDNKQKKF